MSKKAIISGITGQDGSYMAEYLLNNTVQVVGGVRRTSQAILKNIEHLLNNPRFKLFTLDLCDAHSIAGLIEKEKPDYFINFGASTFVADSWNQPSYVMELNANSLIHILEAVRKYQPKCKVYSSGSSEQFGDVFYSPQDMNHPFRPRSIYAVSKIAAGNICKVYRESYGLFVVHGILFNHESKRRQDYFITRKITKGVAKIKRQLERGEKITPIVCGNLDAKRDWSHAGDFVDGIWKMLQQKTPKDYILASGEIHSIREFIETAFSKANLDIKNVNSDNIKPVGILSDCLVSEYALKSYHNETVVESSFEFYRPNEVELLCGDSTPARNELGWAPKFSFDNLVSEMVKYDCDEEIGKCVS